MERKSCCVWRSTKALVYLVLLNPSQTVTTDPLFVTTKPNGPNTTPERSEYGRYKIAERQLPAALCENDPTEN